jgi:hypothetical protein
MLPDNSIFNKEAADQEVIASLLRALKGKKYMPELLQLADGSVVRVHGEVEPVSQEDLQSMHDELIREADQVNGLIVRPDAEAPAADPTPAEVAAEAQPEYNPTPEVPEVAAAPAEAPAPAPPAETVPAPQVTVPEAAPAAPVEQPAAPEVPNIQ